jgi:DNA (cytosine-5)-methyltransferase 1
LKPKLYSNDCDEEFQSDQPWPNAAYNIGSGILVAKSQHGPVYRTSSPIHEFIRFKPKPLSHRASKGIIARLNKGFLRLPPGFLKSLENHLEKAE